MLQILQRSICFNKGVFADLAVNSDLCRKLEKLASILPGEVRHAPNSSLLIQELVRQLRDRAHVNAGQCQCSSWSKCPKGKRNDPAGGGKDDSGIDLRRMLGICASSPDCPKVPCEPPMLLGAREDVGLDPPVAGNLKHEVRRRAEPVQAESLAWLYLGQSQRPIPNRAGAEERCSLVTSKC